MTAWHSYSNRESEADAERRAHEDMMRQGCALLLAAILQLLKDREARA